MSKSKTSPAPLASVESVIHVVRGERVILDADLAGLYGVPTKALNQAVRRNRGKFPPDFLLELTNAEARSLQHHRLQHDTISRSQIVTLKHGKNVKFTPFAFPEHGAIMAANILNSPQAVQMSVFVVRAFMRCGFDTPELVPSCRESGIGFQPMKTAAGSRSHGVASSESRVNQRAF